MLIDHRMARRKVLLFLHPHTIGKLKIGRQLAKSYFNGAFAEKSLSFFFLWKEVKK